MGAVSHNVGRSLRLRPNDALGVADFVDLNDGKISVYPNPAKDIVVVAISNLKSDIATFWLTDITGKCIAKKEMACNHTLFSASLDMKHMAPGMYFITVVSDMERYTTRVIRE